MEREPRVRTPIAAFLVVLVAPLAFLLLMVPGLLAGGVVKLPHHPSPAPNPAPLFIPGGIVPTAPGASNPAPLAIVPSPSPSPAAVTSGPGGAPVLVLAPPAPAPGSVTGGPLVSSAQHGRGKHKGNFHPADSDLHGQGG